IESEIQAGGATPYLVRPIGYTALCGMLELGHTAAKLAFIGPAGCALAFLLTGTVPLGAAQVPPLAVLLVGGASIYLGVQIMIGLSTAWFGTARPLFFIVQKLVFVLGGLIVPLSAYPGVLERVAWLTPFPATLYAPASLALEPGFAHVGGMLVLQAFWLALVLAALAGVAGAFERRLMANGEAGWTVSAGCLRWHTRTFAPRHRPRGASSRSPDSWPRTTSSGSCRRGWSPAWPAP